MNDSNYIMLGKIFLILTAFCLTIMIVTIIRRALDKTKKYKGDHMATGMIIGISMGLLIGVILDGSGVGFVMAMSFGEILGMTIGVLIPKK
ncbi:hypothetical protein [Mogibacterium pumilum]|uniref:DUF2700 domain-containing protein n=1 Tax=Mogibacterium pumilum TaxID=86332 RepID=A0A223ASM0_9FIRM|nr:hypothetical protein [Mogibacterium pumilum]ASS37944.1 hypothetical protein AXF17_05535 [Mogibacterium pumilum]